MKPILYRKPDIGSKKKSSSGSSTLLARGNKAVFFEAEACFLSTQSAVLWQDTKTCSRTKTLFVLQTLTLGQLPVFQGTKPFRWG